ncbi:hypothetical protein GCM10009623_16200 [Nocardioides aestuarii]|uniref:DUF1795 domain-containing protein n=1 Tax=Nocardioides aestuarii TaxID=252231 RepID=A0ABW4TJE0_9ACTN
MGLRTLGLLLALALVGGVGGWAWAEGRDTSVTTQDAPTPVGAADPSLPYTAPEKVKEDSDLPPLGEGIATHEEKMGPKTSEGLIVPVPDGWDRVDYETGIQSRWTAPGNPPGSYFVRVHSLPEDDRSLIQQVAEREAALRFDDRLADGSLEILDSSGDTLTATYVLGGYRQLQVIRWVSFRGGSADVEIAAVGRLVDERGLEELVARIASGVRRQAPAIPPDERPEPSEAPSTTPAG